MEIIRWIRHGLESLFFIRRFLFMTIKSHKAEEPVYITKNGYGDMVIMSMEIYESTMKQLTMYRDIEISEKQTESPGASPPGLSFG